MLEHYPDGAQLFARLTAKKPGIGPRTIKLTGFLGASGGFPVLIKGLIMEYLSMRKEINILKDIIRQPFSWPGGYEKVLIMNDGGIICHKCAKTEYYNILHSTRGQYKDGWQVAGVFLAEEHEDESDYCCHCGTIINS